MKPTVARGRGKKWSQHVTRTSHALDLEAGGPPRHRDKTKQ
jgi:hypothetical protein